MVMVYGKPCLQNSETFKRFEATAVEAYMIIRRNAGMIINLFSMVKGCQVARGDNHMAGLLGEVDMLSCLLFWFSNSSFSYIF